MNKHKPKILILCDYYLPGYKSGGGMRTLVNMVDRMQNQFDFWIVTRDHDGTSDKDSYTTVKINEWNQIRGAQVFYLDKKDISSSKIREIILEVKADSIYVNSYFSTLTIYLLKLRKLKQIPYVEIIIAPCGEFSDGAMQLKTTKKKLFIAFAKLSKLHSNVIWKASTELEEAEIEKICGKGERIFVAPDLPPKIIFENYNQDLKPEKRPGAARMVFLSRFMKKKNFKWLLELLPAVKGELLIDIYGPLEDEEYWNECRQIINSLPANIKVESKGSVPHEQAPESMLNYHFFVLPTLGENFGHVFLEALAVGCPLVISDTTPWLNLEEKGIGWDLSLKKPTEWLEVINQCINMDNATYSKMSLNSRQFVCQWLADPKLEEDTLKVLDFSLNDSLIKSYN